MLTKEQKREFRSHLFRHLDGIAVSPVSYALHDKGVLSSLLEAKSRSVTELATEFGANEGYLNVGLRILASQGWLEMSLDTDVPTYSVNEKSESSSCQPIICFFPLFS